MQHATRNMQQQTNKDSFPLTSNIRSTKDPQPLLVPGLIHPRSLSDALIARRQKYYNHQRDEQRERACHPPLREDDTEVLCGPCKEHLPCSVCIHGIFVLWSTTHVHVALAHVHITVAAVAAMAHVHVSVVH